MPTTMLKVTAANECDFSKEVIQAYLEGPKSGGNVEKDVVAIDHISNGVYCAQMSTIQGKLKYKYYTAGNKVKITIIQM